MSIRLGVVASLLAACAATGGGPRFVYLDSDAYCCGAAEGLGCGLAIAPKLAAIDQLDGVVASSVSWDGLRFRIEVEAGADPERVAAEARELLDGEAACDIPARGTAAANDAGRWFDAEQTIELSRHEAGVIAADFAAKIGAEVALDHESARRVEAALRNELERAFEAAHAAGGTVERLWEQLPAATKRFEARLAELLSPEQGARVMGVIARELDE